MISRILAIPIFMAFGALGQITALASQPDEHLTRVGSAQLHILQQEVELASLGHTPRRVIIMLSDLRTGNLMAAASKSGKLLSPSEALREASRFHFDPDAVVDSFTPGELSQCGIRNPAFVSVRDLVRLYSSVAEGGMLKPGNQLVFPKDRIKVLQGDLLGLVHGKANPIRLARVDGIRVAGAAGHGGRNPVTACFAGYFPADHPRHVCVLVIEGADVVIKYQRGSLLAAPVFSFAAVKIMQLEIKSRLIQHDINP